MGGAQRGDQLGEDGQPPVLGHVGQRVGEHVHDLRHHHDRVGGGGAVGEAVGLRGGGGGGVRDAREAVFADRWSRSPG